jgi:hypothetical protein
MPASLCKWTTSRDNMLGPARAGNQPETCGGEGRGSLGVPWIGVVASFRLAGYQEPSAHTTMASRYMLQSCRSERTMTPEEMAAFVVKNVEPVTHEIYGNRYRVAAHLKDGTYLPCVVLQSKRAQVELALRRFKELQSKRSQYESVVEVFVSAGSRVADHQLRDVELSPFAWPLDILKQVHGETTMGWTAFVVEMRDGTMHSYGTPFNFEFFDLPANYSHADIAKIHSGMIHSPTRGLEPYSLSGSKEVQTWREKPFFTCYLSVLDASS